MISRGGKENFVTAHYDWLVAGIGALALVAAGVFYVMALGENADEAAAEESANLRRLKPESCGVQPVDMSAFAAVAKLARTPVQLAAVPEKLKSFLASERRVKCACGRAIPGDVKAVPKCPYCGLEQEVEKPIVLDADGDGLPDEWEKRYGLNPHDASDAQADKDGDDFTNLEEFQAKTDPTDKKDHPPYWQSLRAQLPVKQTYLSFVFRKAMQIPGGWRCEFFDPKRKDNYGRRGMTLTAKVGEDLADTGFVVKSYEQKTAKEAIKGAAGLTRTIDVSEAVVERKQDKKCVTLVAQQGKVIKPEPVDVQVTLAYDRAGGKTFDLVPGSEFEISGEKYKVVTIKPTGKDATADVEVTIENALTLKKHVIRALER